MKKARDGEEKALWRGRTATTAPETLFTLEAFSAGGFSKLSKSFFFRAQALKSEGKVLPETTLRSKRNQLKLSINREHEPLWPVYLSPPPRAQQEDAPQLLK